MTMFFCLCISRSAYNKTCVARTTPQPPIIVRGCYPRYPITQGESTRGLKNARPFYGVTRSWLIYLPLATFQEAIIVIQPRFPWQYYTNQEFFVYPLHLLSTKPLSFFIYTFCPPQELHFPVPLIPGRHSSFCHVARRPIGGYLPHTGVVRILEQQFPK